MKKLSLASIIAGAMIFSACNGNSSNTTSTDSTGTMTNHDTTANAMGNHDTSAMGNTMNKDTSTMMVSADAKKFTQDAAAGGLMEVELGTIAERNAGSQAVKDFGKMMVDDHTQLNQDLQALATKKNVPLPTGITSSQANDTTKLSKQTGTKFDKDYISMMVKDHEKDIADFKKAGDKIKDPEYKDLITKALPVLQKHLDAAKAIKNKM